MTAKQLLLLTGGTCMDIPVDQAHTQGNLVTAPAWPSHPAGWQRSSHGWVPR